MRIRWGAAVVLALGCARGLDLPNVKPLNASPTTATVAPREQLQITAAGGTPPYTFALQQKQSGDRASVSATGLYQAGDDGPAADVVRLSDATGAKVDVAVAVGASLALSPASALVAPGGRVVFTPTGGKRPYTFKVLKGPGAIGVEGAYTAASTGDTVSQVQVRDATPDAAAVVEVHVGPAVSILPRTEAIAPYATLDFIAIGGQPPYRYSVSSTDGASVNPDTGHYQSGTGTGTTAVLDTVTVTDALSQTATASITTGPPLAAQAPTEVHPFEPARIVATGGAPPYSFAFAAKGDATRGTIDSITGIYTPGSNYGMNDILEIRDATPGGRAVATVTLPPLGPQNLSAQLPRTCLAADLNGDGRQDAVLIGTGDNGTRIDASLMVAGGPPIVIHDNIGSFVAAAVVDLNADRHDDLIILDSTDLHALFANGDGSLSPPFRLATGARRPIAAATLRAPSVPAASPADRAVFYVGNFPVPADCGGAAAGVMSVVWPAGATAPLAPQCTAATPGASAIVTGDFDGDGHVDLAVTNQTTLTVVFGPDFLAGQKVTLTLPANSSFLPALRSNTVLVAGDLDGDGKDDLTAMVAAGTPARNGLLTVTGNASRTLSLGPWMDVAPSAPSGLVGIAGYRTPGLERDLIGWVGDTTLLRIGPDLTLRTPAPPAQTFTVNCVATPDADGDGTPDLLVAGGVELAKVIPGDGDGNFGRRPRVLIGLTPGLHGVDLDGDGADDILYRSGGNTLNVLFGGGHRFSAGPSLNLPFSTFGFLTAPIFAASSHDLVFNAVTDPAPLVSLAHGDGTWDAPQPFTGASGLPPMNSVSVVPADLGGAAPGVDLLIIDFNTFGVFPLVRDDPAHPLQVTQLATVLPPANCVVQAAEDVDGDGVSDLIAECSNTPETLMVSRAAGRGSGLTFGAWQLAATASGGQQLLSGDRLASGRIAFVAGGDPAIPVQVGSFKWNGSGYDANAIDTSLTGPDSSTVAALAPGKESLIVFDGTGLYAYSEQPSGVLGGERKLGIRGANWMFASPAPGAPPDVLVLQGFGIASAPAVLYVNDGTGNFP